MRDTAGWLRHGADGSHLRFCAVRAAAVSRCEVI